MTTGKTRSGKKADDDKVMSKKIMMVKYNLNVDASYAE